MFSFNCKKGLFTLFNSLLKKLYCKSMVRHMAYFSCHSKQQGCIGGIYLSELLWLHCVTEYCGFSMLTLIKNAVKKTTAIFGSGCVCIKLPMSSHYLWEKATCKLRTSGSHCAKTGEHILGSGVWGLSLWAGRHIHRTQPADCYSVYNRDNRMVAGIRTHMKSCIEEIQ